MLFLFRLFYMLRKIMTFYDDAIEKITYRLGEALEEVDNLF